MIRTLDTHPRRFCYIHSAPRVSGMEMSRAFLSRNVLFVAVALLGTARGFIHQSSENLLARHKVQKFSDQKVQIQSAWKSFICLRCGGKMSSMFDQL